MRQLRSAAERRALAMHDNWFVSLVIDDIEVDVDDSSDALITEDGDSSLFLKFYFLVRSKNEVQQCRSK